MRAYFKHNGHKDIDAKIRQSRDDLLLIMQSEHKQLISKVDALEIRLDSRIDGLEARIDGLDKRMDGFDIRMGRMENRMDEQTFQIVSMKKWAIGLFLAVLLAIIALAAPIYISMFL